MKKIRVLLLITAIQTGVMAQDGIPETQMQFMTHLFNSQKDYAICHTDSITGEDEKFKYYFTTEALGNRYVNVLQSKADPTYWYYYVEYPIEKTEDLLYVTNEIQPYIFKVLNVYVKSGRLKGDEKTEGEIVRTNLYVAKSNEWFGELVTDNQQKKFYMLFSNARWE